MTDTLALRFSRTPRAGAAALAVLCMSFAGTAELRASSGEHAVEAQYAGCEADGWCRFRLELPGPSSQVLYRVRPRGVVDASGGDAFSRGVRDRLNALLASMIHQHKRIELRDLRALDDGTHVATVLVHGADVACDPVLRGMLEGTAGGPR